MKSSSSNIVRCDGVNRRDFLHMGFLSAFGLSAGDILRCQAAKPKQKKDLSCILIWLDGGPTHLDTFDLKPGAPVEVRGPFKPIATDVDGVQICEHLPETAKVMKHIALIRSLTHELGNHYTGSHYLLTGHRPTPVIKYPSIGSIVAKETGFDQALPPYIAVPSIRSVGKAGYLPGTYDPFDLGGDPSKPNYQVRDLNPPEWVSFDRVERRRAMQGQLDNFTRHVESSARTETRDSYYEQAYRLLTSPAAKGAFDLRKESTETRQRYGRRRIGTGCLLARRLIEAGSRFVTVVDRGWDTHQDLARNLPDARFPGSGKLPDLDRAYAALITDLADRGMLDTTLVILMGEFGRTPKINARGGRDHWPRAGFVNFAGGGVKGGQVIGATDNYGETPAERPIRPEDVATTLLAMLGIDPQQEYQTPTGRPIKLQAEGSFIRELV
tara:strand:+ start:740 stop:2059 length:1320 start_codon:yes stop_codon:yes gene_type:complete